MLMTVPRLLALSTALPVMFLACGGDDGALPEPTTQAPTPGEDSTTFSLASDAFKTDGSIPARFTCDGEDLSPALTWDGVPDSAQSFALIVDDPDASPGTFTHWVIYNMGGGAPGLSEGVEKIERPDNGAIGFQGRNDFGDIGYGGPCPPAGDAHSYDFRLYAIDGLIDLGPGASKEELLVAMEGRMLAVATMIGTYERAQR
jgi:Raf kinase inhibitor-like YbhB/YbcL family protein